MPVKWDSSLSTGNPELDDQHKAIIDQLNKLEKAMKEGKGRAVVKDILEFTQDYAKKHFACEEAFMEKCKCPIAAANKKAHSEFIKQFGKLKVDFDQNKLDVTTVIAAYESLSNWIINHIRKIDTQLAAYAKK